MTQFMFESGISSLKQALFHLDKYNITQDYQHLRFVLIHLDGAFELIIKKSLINQGIDVIVKYGHTKGVLDCLDEVKKEIKKNEREESHLNELINLNEVTLENIKDAIEVYLEAIDKLTADKETRYVEVANA